MNGKSPSIEKTAPKWGGCMDIVSNRVYSGNRNIDGPKFAFSGIRFGVKSDLLAFAQCSDSGRHDRRNMDKYIIAAVVVRDETKPSAFVKKLYSACIHCRIPPK